MPNRFKRLVHNIFTQLMKGFAQKNRAQALFWCTTDRQI